RRTRTARSKRAWRRRRPARTRSRAPAHGEDERPRAATAAGPARRRPGARCLPAGRPARARGRSRGRSGWRRRARIAPSGAVSAQHLLLVRQLAAVFHQEATLADELRRLDRHDPGLEGLCEPLLLREGEGRLLLFLGLLLGGLLLDEQVLDRLHLRARSRLGGNGGLGQVGLAGL